MKQAVGSTIHCLAGDATGIIAAAAITGTIFHPTDYLIDHGDAVIHLGHVLHAAGKGDEALMAAREALELYDRKGATFLVERTRNLIGGWSGEMG